jgi:hypothetical protein
MILWIVHDENGNILETSAQSGDDKTTGPPVGSSQRIAVIDAPDLAEDAEPDAVLAYIARVTEQNRLELPPEGPKLVRRTE